MRWMNCGIRMDGTWFTIILSISFSYIHLKYVVFLVMLIYGQNFHNILLDSYIWLPFNALKYELNQQIKDQKDFQQDFMSQQNVNIPLYAISIYQMLLDAYKSIQYSKLILLAFLNSYIRSLNRYFLFHLK